MESFNTDAIILKRIEYGEADRIVTFLTPEHGQIRAIAKGVRRPKSKLAGGLELLSISKVTFMKGRSGDLYLVRSARMESHFGNIVKDYDRLEVAYEAIKALYIMTADVSEAGLYQLLHQTLASLNDDTTPLSVVSTWFYLHGLQAIGQQPNLEIDIAGNPLSSEQSYIFDARHGGFAVSGGGMFTANHIKAMRLLLKTEPEVSSKVGGLSASCDDIFPELRMMFDRIISLGA